MNFKTVWSFFLSTVILINSINFIWTTLHWNINLTSLSINKARATLNTTRTCWTPDSRLGDTLDVISQQPSCASWVLLYQVQFYLYLFRLSWYMYSINTKLNWNWTYFSLFKLYYFYWSFKKYIVALFMDIIVLVCLYMYFLY